MTKNTLIHRNILSFCIFPTSVTTITIIHIPQNQPTIQEWIDAAINGDTVLVDTGTYVENINFNGKNIGVGPQGVCKEATVKGNFPKRLGWTIRSCVKRWSSEL